MQIKNHIAYRFLTDPSLQMEMAESMFPDDIQRVLKKESIPAGVRKVAGREQFMTEEAVYGSIKHFLDLTDTPANHKPYYCTETMISLLDRLVVHKKGKHYDWTLFRSLPNQMATFIFPTNDMLRVHIENEMISFLHITYKPIKGEQGNMGWVNFYLNRNTGELCDHFEHVDVINIERFVYALLCFVYLSDNETIYVPAGTRYGTRKTGKLVNDTPFPMTIINSKWNITSIRTDDIEVGAHFRIFHTGPGRTIPRLQFVNAHVRHGYTRRAKSESLNPLPMNTKLRLIATILTCSYLCLFVEYTCIMTDNMRIKKRILILKEGISAKKKLIEQYDLKIKAKKNGPTK